MVKIQLPHPIRKTIMSSGYFVSVKQVVDGRVIDKHFEVTKDVYTYIRQLEECVKNPEHSKLKELYPERFK
jgi:hypothetical protein